MTLHWKAVEQYLTVVLFVFQFYPVCNFGKRLNFGLGTVKSEENLCLHSIKKIMSVGHCLNTKNQQLIDIYIVINDVTG